MSILSPDNFLPLITCIHDKALKAGSLVPLQTTQHPIPRIDSQCVALWVRTDSKSKGPNKCNTSTIVDVFQPYDEGLFIARIHDSHVLLLNKFPLLQHSMVLPTLEFQTQLCHLDYNDVAALLYTCTLVNAFGFYNCGEHAGYSQPHKHMQVIPRKECPSGLPIEQWICVEERPPNVPFKLKQYSFEHAFVTFSQTIHPEDLFTLYRTLLETLRIPLQYPKDEIPMSYNFLFGNRWCGVIPRTMESDDGFFHNSLPFFGFYIIHNESMLKRYQQEGCLRTLEKVTFAEQ